MPGVKSLWKKHGTGFHGKAIVRIRSRSNTEQRQILNCRVRLGNLECLRAQIILVIG